MTAAALRELLRRHVPAGELERGLAQLEALAALAEREARRRAEHRAACAIPDEVRAAQLVLAARVAADFCSRHTDPRWSDVRRAIARSLQVSNWRARVLADELKKNPEAANRLTRAPRDDSRLDNPTPEH